MLFGKLRDRKLLLRQSGTPTYRKSPQTYSTTIAYPSVLRVFESWSASLLDSVSILSHLSSRTFSPTQLRLQVRNQRCRASTATPPCWWCSPSALASCFWPRRGRRCPTQRRSSRRCFSRPRAPPRQRRPSQLGAPPQSRPSRSSQRPPRPLPPPSASSPRRLRSFRLS